MTQEALASDIERVTGWHITRDRYSKYESGRLAIGPTVRRHFVDYWASKDRPGPDAAPTTVAGAGTGDSVSVPADLAAAIRELVVELRESRQERAVLLERVEALEAAAKLRAPTSDGTGARLGARQGSAG